MNTIRIDQTTDSGALKKLTRAIRDSMSTYFLHLNARLDTKPLPTHHRIGSWQRKAK